MGRKHVRYPQKYREEIVELVRSGTPIGEVVKRFEPSEQTIRNWVAQAERDAGRGDGGLTTAEREELRELKREVRRLREERDILKKAAFFFAGETKSTPKHGRSRGSNV